MFALIITGYILFEYLANKAAQTRCPFSVWKIDRETNGLKKFVNAAAFGLNHVSEEFTSGDFLNRLIACYEATYGAADTNVFHPLRRSF